MALGFLRDRQSQETEDRPFVRLVMVGRPAAGKSTLTALLKESAERPVQKRPWWKLPRDPGVPAVEEPTVGIALERVRFGGDSGNLEVSIFDSGGDVAYERAHTLFLDSRAAYIFVCDLEKVDPTKSAGSADNIGLLHWIETLKTVSPGANVILVGTRADLYKRREKELEAKLLYLTRIFHEQCASQDSPSLFRVVAVDSVSRTVIPIANHSLMKMKPEPIQTFAKLVVDMCSATLQGVDPSLWKSIPKFYSAAAVECQEYFSDRVGADHICLESDAFKNLLHSSRNLDDDELERVLLYLDYSSILFYDHKNKYVFPQPRVLVSILYSLLWWKHYNDTKVVAGNDRIPAPPSLDVDYVYMYGDQEAYSFAGLHGRHTGVVVREDTSIGSTTVFVSAQRKSDLRGVLKGLEKAEAFFEGLARHSSTVPDLPEDPADLLVTTRSTRTSLVIEEVGLRSVELGAEGDLPQSVLGAVIELHDEFPQDPVVSNVLETIRARSLPVVVVRSAAFRPDFAARTKNSEGVVVQRIWPAMPTSELEALAADVMGGQILRVLKKENELIADDVCSLVASASAKDALAKRAALPPGYHIPRFPRVVPDGEFGRLMACVEAAAERELVQRWFELAEGSWRLRPVVSVLPAFADGSDPEGSAKAEAEWRSVCEELLRVLGQAASRAFSGEANRDVRSRYLTGFDVPCPDCMDAGVSTPHLFSRDDAVLSWRTDRDKKTLPCSHGHNALLERILRPDCFLSYSWGPWHEDPNLAFPTQKLVQRVKHGIEHSTATEEMPGLMCWFDLERMKGDSQQAMRDGVEQSGLVVIFLDLAYLKSAACNTELTAARQKGKHIVPIVLPGLVEDLRVNTDPKIADSARFLMPTEASDANVSVPLFVDAADAIEERAAKISAHVVDAILRRTCRDTLLSATGFGKRGLLATKAKTVMHAFLLMGRRESPLRPVSVSPPVAAAVNPRRPLSATTPARMTQGQVLEERRRERQARLDASPLKPKRTTLHIDLTKE